MSSDHSRIKLDINKIARKASNIWKLKQHVLNNAWI